MSRCKIFFDRPTLSCVEGNLRIPAQLIETVGVEMVKRKFLLDYCLSSYVPILLKKSYAYSARSEHLAHGVIGQESVGLYNEAPL